MNIVEKEISFKITNTYSTLNELTEKTKNVWFVCHGLGYLSRYFIRHFEELNSDENYIIAPQASSKYYQGSNFKRVGASWLTKENTQKEAQNVLRNLDAVFEAENRTSDKNLIVLGFSQGVSVSMRWVASRKIKCSKLVIFSGGIPNELTKEDFTFLIKNETKVYNIVGSNDEYLNEERKENELKKMNDLFDKQAIIETFEGTHELKKEMLLKII
jgi:predicted esterase